MGKRSPGPYWVGSLLRFSTLLRGGHQASYLNERETRVRNAVTLPFSTFMSILVTSATLKSLSELAAISTALRPASSQDELAYANNLNNLVDCCRRLLLSRCRHLPLRHIKPPINRF